MLTATVVGTGAATFCHTVTNNTSYTFIYYSSVSTTLAEVALAATRSADGQNRIDRTTCTRKEYIFQHTRWICMGEICFVTDASPDEFSKTVLCVQKVGSFVLAYD